MTVSVDIEVASRDSAVLAPLTSIHDLHGANPWVLVLKSGITNKQSIQLGLIGQGWAEILTGLKAGDLLVPLRSGEIVSGLRIRVNGNTSSGSSNSLAVH